MRSAVDHNLKERVTARHNIRVVYLYTSITRLEYGKRSRTNVQRNLHRRRVPSGSEASKVKLVFHVERIS
jgi:hypothetical protein